MYFKDFPAIHCEIKKEEGGKLVGWLDSSSPGQHHKPGSCKAGHSPAGLDPVLRQGLGVSVLTRKPAWKWAAASSAGSCSKEGAGCATAVRGPAWSSMPCGEVPWPGNACPGWQTHAVLPISRRRLLPVPKVLAVICRVFLIPDCPLNQFCEWLMSEQFVGVSGL